MKQLRMSMLTDRQRKILSLVQENQSASNQEILARFPGASRTTIYRELDRLCDLQLLVRSGGGRNVRYQEKVGHELSRHIDPETYFSVGPDERADVRTTYDPGVLSKLSPVFSKEERSELDEVTKAYRKRVKTLSPVTLKKEFERLTIELAWKSSQIEGNTYSLIDTETLLRERREAPGHTKEEATMLLNHKTALDYIRDPRTDFKKLTVLKIRNVHALLVKDLGVDSKLRTRAVGITGTRYAPLDNRHQIQDAMDALVRKINAAKSAFDKAVLAMLMIAYIQPFQDGNKRASRLVGDALLLAHGACPLSFRSIDEGEYKMAMLLFYEQRNIRLFKRLFQEQYRFAVEHYFL